MEVETNIRYNRNLNEYTVELIVDGVHIPDADYYTDHRHDAEITAEEMVKYYKKHHKEERLKDYLKEIIKGGTI